jgi:hypothetical protein
MKYIITEDIYNKLQGIYPQIEEEVIPVFSGLCWTHEDLAEVVQDGLMSDPDVPKLTPGQVEDIVIDITNDIINKNHHIDAECVDRAITEIATLYVRKKFPLTTVG